MKYSKFKTILTLFAVAFCSWGTAQEVVKVRLCGETEPFLFGCETFTSTGIYPNAGGTGKTLDLIYGQPSPESTLKDTIEVGETYLFGCEPIVGTTAGEINRTETFKNVSGCDSVVHLILTVKAACESITIELIDSVHVGEYYLFGCQTLFSEEVSTLTATETYQKADGCDSIVNLTLKVQPNTVYSDTVANVCEGDLPYSWHGYTIYNDTICSDTIELAQYDSIVTLTLNVFRSQYAEVEDKLICINENYTWRGHTYFNEGIYFDTVQYANGCDSMIYQLSLREAKVFVVDPVNASICAGETYTWRGHQYNETNIYYDTIRYAECGCDSAIYTLNLTVNAAALTQADTVTICGGDYHDWLGHRYSVAGDYADTIRYASGCDSLQATLHLVVDTFMIEEPVVATICAGDSIEWGGIFLKETGIYPDTIKYSGSACDSIARTLVLTVTDTIKVAISKTMCLVDAQATYPDLNITGTDVYTRLSSTAAGCDSITEYHITILDNPSVPALKDLKVQPIVACGMPIVLDGVAEQIARELRMQENATTASVDTFWIEKKLPEDAQFTALNEEDTIKTYLDEPIQLRLAAITECGDTLYGNAAEFEVEKPSPILPGFDNLPAVGMYGNRILMVNVNHAMELGYIFTDEDVTWYQVVGEIDEVAGQGNDPDKVVGTGFYYTIDDASRIVGSYYAVIDAESVNLGVCGAYIRTVVIRCTVESAPMRLVPNTIHVGESMELINLDPETNAQVMMYDYDGKLIETEETIGTDRLRLQPEQGVGVYMLRVSNGSNEATFKYVITK